MILNTDLFGGAFLGLVQDFLRMLVFFARFSGLIFWGNLFRKQWNSLSKWNILRKIEHFEKNPDIFVLFLASFFLLFSICLFLCHLDLLGNPIFFKENSGISEKNPGTFEKHLGPTRTLGEPLVKIPTNLVPLFVRLSKRKKKWENLCQFWMGFGLHAHKCHWPAQHRYSDQVQSDSLPSVFYKRHTENVEREFARGTWSSGKWYLQKSLPIPSFLKCFTTICFFFRKRLLSYFGGAKNPTDPKPYWSRVGLRHPEWISSHSWFIGKKNIKTEHLCSEWMGVHLSRLNVVQHGRIPQQNIEILLWVTFKRKIAQVRWL